MVVVFSAFGLSSDHLEVIGFGLALAILPDATVVRALVVPASMRLMQGNWWTPDWLGGSKNAEKVKGIRGMNGKHQCN